MYICMYAFGKCTMKKLFQSGYIVHICLLRIAYYNAKFVAASVPFSFFYVQICNLKNKLFLGQAVIINKFGKLIRCFV